MMFLRQNRKVSALMTPGGELDPQAEEEVGQTWQTQIYCAGLLGMSGRTHCQCGLQFPAVRFNQFTREDGDIESK